MHRHSAAELHPDERNFVLSLRKAWDDESVSTSLKVGYMDKRN